MSRRNKSAVAVKSYPELLTKSKVKLENLIPKSFLVIFSDVILSL